MIPSCLIMLGRAPLAGILAVSIFLASCSTTEAAEPSGRPLHCDDARFWLGNMFWYHRFTTEEISAATGMSIPEVDEALRTHGIWTGNHPGWPVMKVLPYPGGRHPRIGFLDGAIDPQRETKFSVFTPWGDGSYVVVDLPEALWSNLGLTYLAHTHVPTIWTEKGIKLEPLEWNCGRGGRLEIERRLPNGIAFRVKVVPAADAVRMEMSLTNGTSVALSDLRVQACVMLKGAAEFEKQTNDNKVLTNPYCACRSSLGIRWVITAWEGCVRPWGNEKCPCLHSDPQFPDCPPGETKRLRGWLSFYEGDDVHAEFDRIEATGWRN